MELRKREYLSEAAKGKTFFDCLLGAHVEFFEAAKPGIKKIAKGHLKKLVVNRGKSVIFLKYDGTDSSDHNLTLTFYVINKDPSAKLVISGKGAKGNIYEEVNTTTGNLTTDTIVQKFKGYFG